MILAIHLVMTGRVDRGSEVSAQHQPRPVRVDADFIELSGERVSRAIRPENWTVPAHLAVKDADKIGARLVTVMASLKDMVDAAEHIVAHDVEELDWAVKVCRAICRRPTEWFPPRRTITDTAVQSAIAMGMEKGLPSLSAATEAILGERDDTLMGMVRLFHSDALSKPQEVLEPA